MKLQPMRFFELWALLQLQLLQLLQFTRPLIPPLGRLPSETLPRMCALQALALARYKLLILLGLYGARVGLVDTLRR